MQYAASVPGKLFLSGEYSVLWGGTARVAAVAPRMTGLVRRRSDHELQLAVRSDRLFGKVESFGARWGEPVSEPFRYVAEAVNQVLRARPRTPGIGLELAFSTNASLNGQKLGLGGSAQATVLGVELIRFALEDEIDVLEHSLLAHREAQAGRGSGADVAAVFTGGVIRYRSSPRELVSLPPLRAHLGYVHSGQSARTSEILAAVEGKVPPKARLRFVSEADALGEATERALLKGDFGSLKRSLVDQEALLSSLDVETESIRQILALAASCGCAGKISGAGLGDGCVLFSPDADAEASMLAALRSLGFWATPVQIEPGLRTEEPSQELARLFEA